MQLKTEQEEEKVTQLTEFIKSNPDPRELKRALAVKMVADGKCYTEISRLVGISQARISYWKQQYANQGIEGIKLGYQGAKRLVSTQEREEIIKWLTEKNYWNLEELVAHIETKYGIIYQSKQSYYELFAAAKISWKRTQKSNPKSDPEQVKKKRRDSRVHQSQSGTDRGGRTNSPVLR
jgi:putative transposase